MKGVDFFSAKTPMRKVISRVFSDRFVVESTTGLTYVPSTSQDAGDCDSLAGRFRGWIWKQSQSPGFESAGVCSQVRNKENGIFSSVRASLELSRNAATGFFNNVSFVSSSLVEPVSRARTFPSWENLRKFTAPSPTKRRLPRWIEAAWSYTVEIELYRPFGATVVTIGNWTRIPAVGPYIYTSPRTRRTSPATRRP